MMFAFTLQRWISISRLDHEQQLKRKNDLHFSCNFKFCTKLFLFGLEGKIANKNFGRSHFECRVVENAFSNGMVVQQRTRRRVLGKDGAMPAEDDESMLAAFLLSFFFAASLTFWWSCGLRWLRLRCLVLWSQRCRCWPDARGCVFLVASIGWSLGQDTRFSSGKAGFCRVGRVGEEWFRCWKLLGWGLLFDEECFG